MILMSLLEEYRDDETRVLDEVKKAVKVSSSLIMLLLLIITDKGGKRSRAAVTRIG